MSELEKTKKADSTDHDQLFKKLITKYFEDFINVFVPQLAEYVELDNMEFLSQELFGDEKREQRQYVDVVAEVRFKGEPTTFLVHIESQAQKEKDFNRRMFHYFARLDEKYNRPVYPIALFTYDEPIKEDTTKNYEVVFPDKKVLEYNYETIQLNRLNWKDFIRHEDPVSLLLMSKMRIEPENRRRAKLECHRILMGKELDIEELKFLSGFINTYLKLSEQEESQFREELLKSLPNKEKEIMEIMNSWEEAGYKRGQLDGRMEGRQQGINSLVLRWLNRQVDSIDTALEEQINTLPIEQSEALAEALFDFKEEADLIQWLQVNAPKEASH